MYHYLNSSIQTATLLGVKSHFLATSTMVRYPSIIQLPFITLSRKIRFKSIYYHKIYSMPTSELCQYLTLTLAKKHTISTGHGRLLHCPTLIDFTWFLTDIPLRMFLLRRSPREIILSRGDLKLHHNAWDWRCEDSEGRRHRGSRSPRICYPLLSDYAANWQNWQKKRWIFVNCVIWLFDIWLL